MYLYGEEAWACMHCERLTYPQFNGHIHLCQHCGQEVTQIVECPQCKTQSFVGTIWDCEICSYCDGAGYIYKWIKGQEERD